MDFTKIINSRLIKLDLKGTTRKEMVAELALVLFKEGIVTDLAEFIQSVEEREHLTSTYTGNELAIPHGLSTSVVRPAICFGRCNAPVDWDGDGTTPVRYVFLIAVNRQENSGDDLHLQIISAIAIAAMDEENLRIWDRASNPEEVMNSLSHIIEDAEKSPLF